MQLVVNIYRLLLNLPCNAIINQIINVRLIKELTFNEKKKKLILIQGLRERVGLLTFKEVS